MKIDTLRDLYVIGIQDMNNGCRKSFSAMEAMRDAATHPELRELMGQALKAMEHSREMFDDILTRQGAQKGHDRNKALTALSEEGRELAGETDYGDPDLRDLAIVSKVRNLAHCPTAGFLAFVAQARTLGLDEDVEMLTGRKNPVTGDRASLDRMDRIERELLSKSSLPKAA